MLANAGNTWDQLCGKDIAIVQRYPDHVSNGCFIIGFFGFNLSFMKCRAMADKDEEST